MYFVTGHPYYVGIQYHPEYLSRPLKTSAPYLGFILAATKMLDKYISRDCKLSPRQEFYVDTSDEDSRDASPPPIKRTKATADSNPNASKPVASKVSLSTTNGSSFKPVGNGVGA